MESEDRRTPPGSNEAEAPEEPARAAPAEAEPSGAPPTGEGPPAESSPGRPGGRAGREFETEAQIDSPSLRTLWFLGVVFLVTAASWSAARFACNYHPPQSRPPPEVPTERLAGSPRGAAIELAHRFRTKHFDGARELAKAPLTQEIEKAAAECERQGAACVKERARLEKTILTTGVLTELTNERAVAHVTHHIEGGTEKLEVRVEKDGSVWKAVSTRKL
jgi:hypothetical protein